MINKLIAAVIAFLLGAVITHAHWYQVNLRLQRTHKRELKRALIESNNVSYENGFKYGRWAAQIDFLLKPPALAE